mmetsp:Transcript_14360/g.19168  ORF Transcript_14360/g.19168 Transcript_14360/m.19168 type:complete len:210 (+) Transcript_14360:523-1152(+)
MSSIPTSPSWAVLRVFFFFNLGSDSGDTFCCAWSFFAALEGRRRLVAGGDTTITSGSDCLSSFSIPSSTPTLLLSFNLPAFVVDRRVFLRRKKGNVCCPFPLNLGETTGTLFSAAAVVAEWNKVDDGTSLCGGVGGGSSSTICDPSLLSKHVISLEILVVAREGAGVLIEERETVNDPVKSDKFNFISDDVMLGMTTCGEALEDASFCA